MANHIDTSGPHQDHADQHREIEPANHPATPTTSTANPSPTERAAESALDFWVNEVRAALGGVVSATVDVGRTIQTAKQHLGYGRFQALLRRPEFPLDDRVAQMLVRVGTHHVLADESNHLDLPHGVVPLYIISGLDPDLVATALEKGQIHPAMSVQEVKEFARTTVTSQGTIHPSDSTVI